jgi:hypothetical protein
MSGPRVQKGETERLRGVRRLLRREIFHGGMACKHCGEVEFDEGEEVHFVDAIRESQAP